jgi:phosphotransferase system enzyme I (PtsP)
MLPMVSAVYEVDEARSLIERAHQEVLEEGFAVRLPPIGVMVEVPAAVYQADALCRHADFLSVGSNDLTQYLLAVDRNNPQVADLYNAFHPAVLTAIRQVVAAAKRSGRDVSICGELAGDPAGALLMAAMGFDGLSMNATSLPRVKSVLRLFTMDEARELLDEAMALETAAEIRQLLESRLRARGVSSRLINLSV